MNKDLQRILSVILLIFLCHPVLAEEGKTQRHPAQTAGFIENKGQIIDQNNKPNPSVLYLLNTPGMNVQLRSGGFSYDLYIPTSDSLPTGEGKAVHAPVPNGEKAVGRGWKFHRIDFNLLNASPACEITTSGQSADYANYYTTSTPAEGVTNVRSYQTVTYNNIYPNIDLEFMTDAKSVVKYNFVVHPGGKLSSIQMKISDPEIEVNKTGSLLLKTGQGTIEESIPESHYKLAGDDKVVKVRFYNVSPGVYGFLCESPIPTNATLTIDPVPDRVWGSYYGGEAEEVVWCSTVDNSGNCHIAGRTTSNTNIATAGAHQTVIGGTSDGFLARFTPGGLRTWATYYGGFGSDEFHGIAMTPDDHIALSGITSSPDNIATPGSHQPSIGSIGFGDAFLVKFDNTGVRQWGTYYGGSSNENGMGCTTDLTGNIYFTGTTKSANNIATTGSHQSTFGGENDIFLVKFTPGGNRIWGTYYGGTCDDYAGSFSGCAVDGNSFVYISGTTCSLENISTTGSFQSSLNGGADGVLVKFNTDGIRQWGTYYGGPSDDVINVVKVTPLGNIMIAGEVLSQSGIASPGAFQTVFGGGYEDAMVGVFYPDGQRYWVTYYGGTGVDAAVSGGCDNTGNVYIAGRTNSPGSIATSNSFQEVFGGGGYDGMLVRFSPTGDRLWGTYYGGEGTDQSNGFSYYNYNAIYMAGATGSITSMSTAGTQQVLYGGGGEDSFLAKFTECTPPIITITGNTSVYQGSSEIYTTQPGMTGYTWTYSPGGNGVSGGTVTDNTITIQWNTLGAQWVRVNYTNADGCSATDPFQLDVTVLPNPVTIGFDSPDTTCVNHAVNIVNTTTGGTTYYWNFCSGDANIDPTGMNIGNPGNLLSIPTYITLVKQGNDCFSFVSCQGVGVIRYYHGTSFSNNPVSWTNLGQFGIINFNQEGIQVKFDNGNWYGFVNSFNTIIRLDFGNSLWNTPTATDIGPFSSLNMAHGLVITREGTTWIGLVTCSIGQNLVRLDFGSSLINTPVATDFGDLGGVLTSPFSICLVQENSLWYALVVASGSTLARITFGTSLLNTPTGVNLGNPGGFNAACGLTLLRDCESTTGYWVNYLVNGELGKLTFPEGITGPVTGTVLGNIGGLARPGLFSELFRENDNLYAYITNRDNHTLTRLSFAPCTNASIPSSTLFTPPPVSYNQPGTYNIRLITDEGLPTMAGLCKPIVVMDPPVIDLGNDEVICQGNSVTLDAGALFSNYLWSTGATTQTVTVSAAGNYSVTATRWGCEASDEVNVSVTTGPVVDLGADRSICSGLTTTFDAGFCAGCTYLWANLTTGQMNIGTNQTLTTDEAAHYQVTVTDATNCQNSDDIWLTVDLQLPVSITVTTPSSTVCAGTSVTFTANPTNGGVNPIFQWKVNGANAGTGGQTYTYTPASGDLVSCILTSSEICTSGNPANSNPVTMTVNTNLPAGVTIAATPNPFCAGSSVTLTATPINGGLTPSYQWKVNAVNVVNANNAVYTYTPLNGDLAECIMTSSEICSSGNPATSLPLLLTALPAPDVTFTPCFDMVTTVDARPIKLHGGLPTGGTYTGPGVNTATGVFTPSVAGTGTKTITYSYTNAASCSASQSLEITVADAPAFTCGNNLIDIRDNKVYPTVQIGTQCWMQKNLEFGITIDELIQQTDNCVSEKYTPNTSLITPNSFYQWDEVMDYDNTPGVKGLCPPGWHVPDESEWTTLFNYYLGNSRAGYPLQDPYLNGFKAQQNGVYYLNSMWSFTDFATLFWSSTMAGQTRAYAHGMNTMDQSVSVYAGVKANGFSVRCIKD
jgi:uncharacterized protein (TIGR02145 family)